MNDSSDDELVLKRVSSQKEKPKYDVVPSDMTFCFKFKDFGGKSYSLLEYPLSEGKKLPYITVLEGD